jgi:hypothetical protein
VLFTRLVFLGHTSEQLKKERRFRNRLPLLEMEKLIRYFMLPKHTAFVLKRTPSETNINRASDLSEEAKLGFDRQDLTNENDLLVGGIFLTSLMGELQKHNIVSTALTNNLLCSSLAD